MTSRQDEDILRSKIRWALAAVTAVAYWHVSSYDFVNYDDPVFVSSNPHVYSGLSFANMIWSLTTLNGGATSYQPLVWLTHQLDCQLFGLKAGAQHLTNLWFHIANTVLLFTLLDRLTGKVWRSAAVAALFALHPLHVETVAWISERKSLVCVFFWMLTTLAYLRYVKEKCFRSFLVVLILFAAALLSKPIAVSLPITLVLLDYWPLERWRQQQNASLGRLGENADCACGLEDVTKGSRSPLRLCLQRPLLVEKAPMFAMSAICCLITVVAQNDLGATKSLQDVPMDVRLSNSVVACVLYLRKMFWPTDLAPIYLLRHDWTWWQVLSCGFFLLAISAWFLSQARKRGYLIVGWVWFLITLLPTLGFVQVGSQGMADRYTYVPLIGIFLLLVWSVPGCVAKNRPRKLLLGTGAAAFIGMLGISTAMTVGNWRDSVRLFEHAVRVTRNNYIAYCQLGVALGEKGNIAEAKRLLLESLKIKPNQLVAELDLGEALYREGDDKGAMEYFLHASNSFPMDPTAHNMMAEIFLNARDPKCRDPVKALCESRLACALSHYANRLVLEKLARICLVNREFREARETGQKALTLCAAPEEVEEANVLLTDVTRAEQDEKKRGTTGTRSGDDRADIQERSGSASRLFHEQANENSDRH